MLSSRSSLSSFNFGSLSSGTFRFFHAAGSMMRSCFLDELPLAVKAIPLPEDDGSLKSVFVEVKADGAGEVSVPTLLDPLAENLVNLERNVVYLLPYKSISSLVEQDKVLLM